MKVFYNSGGKRLVALEAEKNEEGTWDLKNSSGNVVVTGIVEICTGAPAPGGASSDLSPAPAAAEEVAPVVPDPDPENEDPAPPETEIDLTNVEDKVQFFSTRLQAGEAVTAADLVKHLEKDELVELAGIFGVEVAASATKPVIAEAILADDD